MECSIIMPFCNEVPQCLFTIQSLIEELDGFCKYEILAIDNMSDQYINCQTDADYDGKTIKIGDHSRSFPVRQREFFHQKVFNKKLNMEVDRFIGTYFFKKGIVKYLQYDARQGHWQAKNYGIANSTGKYLFFIDAHCVMKRDSLRKMIQFLRDRPNEKIGGVHAYINYMLDSHSLEYKPQKKTFGYQFCSAQTVWQDLPNGKKRAVRRPEPYQVCVMSTCGMLTPRSAIEALGGWNKELGIYGGGESYINWKQSTCGWSHWIHPECECWHWAEKRGYSWNHTDFVRNSFIAAYCVGGDEFLNQQVELRCQKDRPEVIERLAADIRENCTDDMEFIRNNQIISFNDYIDYWTENPGSWVK